MPHHSQLCTQVSPECPVSDTIYGYYPNLPGNALLCAIFAICALFQLYFGIRYKLAAFTVATVMGCAGEAIGYVGRILMHSNPWAQANFDIQICCLVLSPSFLAAGVYLALKHLVLHFGPEHSLLRPNLYPPIFIGCDLVSIFMQAAGGGTAASETSKLVVVGDKIIVAGIAFQVATMSICGLLGGVFAYRVWSARKKEGRPMFANEKKGFEFYLLSTTIAFSTIYIRCIYRIPEMAGGWGNPLMRREPEFLVLDGAMVAIAAILMTVAHPGRLFPEISSRYTKRQRANVELADQETGLDMRPMHADEGGYNGDSSSVEKMVPTHSQLERDGEDSPKVSSSIRE